MTERMEQPAGAEDAAEGGSAGRAEAAREAEAVRAGERLVSRIEPLERAIKRLYVWLVSRPELLFQETDALRMDGPIIHVKQTGDWISRSAVAKTDWFFEHGHALLLRRLRQGDYDSYE